tara:strand:- start:1039 stop:1248 length:210 start_codon:yes stop_codon:yes gene_type:complete
MTKEDIESNIYCDGLIGSDGREYLEQYTKAQRIKMIEDYAEQYHQEQVKAGVTKCKHEDSKIIGYYYSV